LSPYLKQTLSNGIEVIAEQFDTVQSVSIGMFLKSGVLYENERQQGVSHFIEHMLFKGTKKLLLLLRQSGQRPSRCRG